MKKRLILSTLVLLSLANPKNAFALTKDNWQKVASKTEYLTKLEQKNLEESLEKRVALLKENAEKQGKNELYRYRITPNNNDLEEIITISNHQSFQDESSAIQWSLENELPKSNYKFIQNKIKPFQVEKIFEKTKYNTQEEANLALNQFNQTLDNPSNDLKITKERNKEKDQSTLLEYKEEYSTKEEAQNKAKSLEEDTEAYQVIVKVEKKTITSGKDTKELKETFKTKKEAEEFIDKLKKEGYQVDATIKEKTKPEKLTYTGEKRATLEEAEKDLEAFFKEYPNNQEGEVKKIKDQSMDKVEEKVLGEEEYTTLEEAEKAMQEKNQENEDYKIDATIRMEQKSTITKEEIKSKIFDSKLEAENYIKELKDKGYDTKNLETKLLSYEESNWKTDDEVVVDPGTKDDETFSYGHFDITLLNKFTKIDATGKTTEVQGSIKINNVKINNKNIEMNKLSNDPNTGLLEYTSTKRHGLDVTNKSYVEITGSITFNNQTLPFTVKGYLSEKQNVCGGKGDAKGYDLKFNSIKIIENKVYIDSNIINKYQVVGEITKEETKNVWYIDTVKTIKGYAYQAIASGEKEIIEGYEVTGTKSKDLIKEVYYLKGEKITKGYDYYVSGKGQKTFYDVISTYHKMTEINWIIEKLSLNTGSVEVTPPKTGIISNNKTILLLLFPLLLISLKMRKKYN